jgi:hypothetical protein
MGTALLDGGIGWLGAKSPGSGGGKEDGQRFEKRGDGGILFGPLETPRSRGGAGRPATTSRSLTSMLGVEAEIVVRHEQYKGKAYARFAWVSHDHVGSSQEDLPQESRTPPRRPPAAVVIVRFDVETARR